jgi:excinuclease ABC subunit B
MAYNEANGITPTTIFKSKEDIFKQASVLDIKGDKMKRVYVESDDAPSIAADPLVQYATKPQLEKQAKEVERRMKAAAKDLDFMTAAQLRDELFTLQKMIKDK